MSDEEPRQDTVPPGYAAGAGLPWWGKMAAKLAISALRVPPGLLRRAADPENRRSLLLELTPAGSGVLEELGRRSRDSAAEAFAVLDPSDRRSLLLLGLGLGLRGRLCSARRRWWVRCRASSRCAGSACHTVSPTSPV